MTTLKQLLKNYFQQAITNAYGQKYADLDPQIQTVHAPHIGDYQANFAMRLAKQLAEKPQTVAERVVDAFPDRDICDQISVTGPGFICCVLSKAFVEGQLQNLIDDDRLGVPDVHSTDKVIIEYGSPNVAKEMHVGHLRSTIIGDAIARILSFMGYLVVRQNHIGDWGTQFGMLIEYLQEVNWSFSEEHTISEASMLYKKAKQRFDEDPEFARKAREKVVSLQRGDRETLACWQHLVEESERHFQTMYERLGVLLTQADICGESFYNPMLPQIVKELQDQGIATQSDEATVVFLDGFTDKEGKAVPCIIQKSDGGYLYATTDLAAIKYRTQQLGAKRIVYVVDARQAQHFAMVFAIARKANWILPDTVLEHAPFGTILGKDRKPFKTRSGETVQLSSLVDEAEKRAGEIVAEKTEFSDQQKQHIAKAIGIGALKYADLSTDKIKDYVFDWDRMLAFEGNTAPYLMNAYVRIQSIFRKGNVDLASLRQHSLHLTTDFEKELGLRILELPEVIALAGKELAPHRLCSYLYELAASFHKFYEHCPVLNNPEQDIQQSRLLLCDLTARTLKLGLELLGIEVLEQM